jgi:hypothetical protein
MARPQPNLKKDFLQTVFSLLTVIQYTQDLAEEDYPVPIITSSQRSFVAARDCEQEVFIINLGKFSLHAFSDC